MADRFDFDGFFRDPEFHKLDDTGQQAAVDEAWKIAAQRDPELATLEGQDRNDFLSSVYEKAVAKANAEREQSPQEKWAGFTKLVSAADSLGVPGVGVLGQDGFFGSFVRGGERGLVGMTAGVPTTIGNLATEAVNMGTQLTDEGFHATQTYDRITDLAREHYGLENPEPADLFRVIRDLDPEEYDIPEIQRQVSLEASRRQQTQGVYDTTAPIANWVRQFEAPASPGEMRGDLSQVIGSGLGSAGALAIPTLAASLATGGAATLPALLASSTALGVEEASRPIEEEYGQYSPGPALVSGAAQGALETVAGPEARVFSTIGKRLISKLARSVPKAMLRNMAEEGITEGTQQFLAIQAKKWTEGERDFFFNMTPEEKLQILNEAKAGAAVGGILGGGGAVVGKTVERAKEKGFEAQLELEEIRQDEAQERLQTTERPRPTHTRARQVFGENAPPRLQQEGREAQLDQFVTGEELDEETLAAIATEDATDVETVRGEIAASEQASFESLGIASREDIGTPATVEGADDPGTAAGRSLEFIRQDLRERAAQETDPRKRAALEKAAAEVTLTKPDTQEEIAMHRVASRRGIEVMFTDNRLAVAGASVEPGIVVLDRNATKNQQVKQVLIHEMTHQLRGSNSAAWTQLSSFVRKNFRDDWRKAQARVKADPAYADLKGDDLIEEIFAQVAEARGEQIWKGLQNEAKLEALYKKPGVIGKVLRWIGKHAGEMAKAAGMNIVTRKDLEDAWALPYEVVRTLNGMKGAPRSTIARDGKLEAPQKQARTTPETAPEAKEDPDVLQFPQRGTEESEAVPERKAAATRKKRKRKKKRKKRKLGRKATRDLSPNEQVEAQFGFADGQLSNPKTDRLTFLSDAPDGRIEAYFETDSGEDYSVYVKPEDPQYEGLSDIMKRPGTQQSGGRMATRVDEGVKNELTHKQLGGQRGSPIQRFNQGRDEGTAELRELDVKYRSKVVSQMNGEDQGDGQNTGPKLATRLPGFYLHSSREVNQLMSDGTRALKAEGLISRLQSKNVGVDELIHLGLAMRQGRKLVPGPVLELAARDSKGRVELSWVKEFLDEGGIRVEEVLLKETLTDEERTAAMPGLANRTRPPASEDEASVLWLERHGVVVWSMETGVDPDEAFLFIERTALVEELDGTLDSNEVSNTEHLVEVMTDALEGIDDMDEQGEDEAAIFAVGTEEDFAEFGEVPMQGGDIPGVKVFTDLESAREYALKMHADGMASRKASGFSYLDWAEKVFGKTEDFFAEGVGKALFGPSSSIGSGYTTHLTGTNESYMELLFTLPGDRYRKGSKFLDHHYNGDWGGDPRPGVAAHVRFQVFTNPDGTTTLFIEEIQSDLESELRKQADADKLIDFLVEMEKKYGKSTEPFYVSEWRRIMTDEADFNRYRKYVGAARSARAYVSGHESAEAGPMVSEKSTAWVHMIARRMLRWAAENGHQHIAWTTPETQVERSQTQLRQKVKRYQWETLKNGNKKVSLEGVRADIQAVFDKSGLNIDDDAIADPSKAASISQLVPTQEVAIRVMEEPEGTISAEDIVIGAGMFQKLYANVLPSAFNAAAEEIGAKPFTQLGQAAVELPDGRISPSDYAKALKEAFPDPGERARILDLLEDIPMSKNKKTGEPAHDMKKVKARLKSLPDDTSLPGDVELIRADWTADLSDDAEFEQFKRERGGEMTAEEAEAELVSGGKPIHYIMEMYHPASGWSRNASQLSPAEYEVPKSNEIWETDDTKHYYIKAIDSDFGSKPGAALYGLTISDSQAATINGETFKAKLATRGPTSVPGQQAQMLILSPGEQWGNVISERVNSFLDRVGIKDKNGKVLMLEDYVIYIQSHFKRVKDLQNQLIAQGIYLPESLNTALHEEMMYGRTDNEVKKVRRALVVPLLKTMNENGVTKEKGDAFFQAMHAFERNRRGWELNVTNKKAELQEKLASAKSDQAKREIEADIKAVDDMIQNDLVGGSGTNDAVAMALLQELVESGELEMDLDAFAQAYGYKDANDAATAGRRRRQKAMRKGMGRFEGDIGGAYGSVMSAMQALTQGMLDLQLQYELTNEQVHRTISDMYQFYVPLKGRFEPDSGDVDSILTTPGLPARVGEFLDIRGAEGKRALGRVSAPRYSPIGQALQDLERTVVRGEKNTVGRVFLEFVEEYLPPSVAEVNKVAMRKVFDTTTNSVKEVNDFWFNERPNVFAAKRGGEIYFITLKDERLAVAMKALGQQNMGTFAKLHGKAMRMLAQLATSLNPEFWLSNAARDIQTAIFNSLGDQTPMSENELAKMLTRIPAAARAIQHAEMMDVRAKENVRDGHWDKRWQLMQDLGARIGYYGLSPVEETFARADKELHYVGKEGVKVAVLKSWQAGWGFIESVNTAFENATRLVAFDAALRAGATELQAASIARNLTVNFNNHGAWRGLSSWYMFANANVQGVARMFQALGNPEVRSLMRKLTLNSALIARWNRWVMGEDDDGNDRWDNLSRYHKGKRILIAMPAVGGRYYMVGIPVPHGFSVFHSFGNGLERIAHHVPGGAKATADAVAWTGVEMMSSLADSFNPLGGRFDSWKGAFSNFVPTIPRIFWDMAANEDYAGRQIMPNYYEKGTPWYQTHHQGASDWAIFASREISRFTGGDQIKPGMMNLSPDALDFLLKAASSGLGSFITDGAKFSKNMVVGDETPWYKVPFLRRFAYEYSPTEAVDEYYELRSRLWKVRRDFTAARSEGNRALMKDIRKDYRHLLDTGLYQQLQRAEKLRRRAKQMGDREAETKAMLRWLKYYRRTMKRTYG